jgi:hypothetical protein
MDGRRLKHLALSHGQHRWADRIYNYNFSLQQRKFTTRVDCIIVIFSLFGGCCARTVIFERFYSSCGPVLKPEATEHGTTEHGTGDRRRGPVEIGVDKQWDQILYNRLLPWLNLSLPVQDDRPMPSPPHSSFNPASYTRTFGSPISSRPASFDNGNRYLSGPSPNQLLECVHTFPVHPSLLLTPLSSLAVALR